ncbi:MAG: T9SS type A sorting domain-containing protein [Chitinophagales bacterium]|nr:T9SS type A sorting domain-containing protein [Chitinophagales bacterium]
MYTSRIKLFFISILLLGSFSQLKAQSLNPYTIGTLHPGDSMVIYYDVTINNGCGCGQISNQGVVSGSNFSSFNTDDPDTGVPGDATLTLLNMFPLPVHLLEVKAAYQQNVVNISWKVVNEENMVRYEVEKSYDGRVFSKIGEVSAVNNPGPANYSFTDLGMLGTINFYRLRYTDLSSTKYSAIIRVNVNTSKSSVKVYPNPVIQSSIGLQWTNAEKGNYSLCFYNNLGQMVYTTMLFHEGGSATRSFSLPTQLRKGLYHLQIRSGRETYTELLIIQ